MRLVIVFTGLCLTAYAQSTGGKACLHFRWMSKY